MTDIERRQLLADLDAILAGELPDSGQASASALTLRGLDDGQITLGEAEDILGWLMGTAIKEHGLK